MTNDAHNDPTFLAMCREHGIDGTAQVALCGAFWNRAVATKEGAAEPVGVALDWTKIEAFVDGYVDEYEMRGETEDGRDACYTPNDNDRALLRDCIAGLLSEPEFIAAFATPPAVMPAAPSDAGIDALWHKAESTGLGYMATHLRAREFARLLLSQTMQPQAGVMAPVPYDKHEAEILAVIDERDRYHDMADQLAAQIAAITETDLGEHSSDNDPWRNAMLAADEWIARALRAMFAGESEPRSRRAQAEPAAGEQAGAVALRKGHVVVPMRLTRAMQRILDEEGWEWADLLMAAEATTEEEDEAIRRFESLDMLEKAEREAAEQQDLAAPGAAIAAREQDEHGRKAFARYLKECEECVISPDVAGAFHWAWTHSVSREEAPATPQGETIISDAMVDAYLKAQRETVERVDREWGGKTGKAAEHLHPVREACRNGLRAALTQPTTLQQAAGVHALSEVVRLLRKQGHYEDEEGEATNQLADLLDALKGMQPGERKEGE